MIFRDKEAENPGNKIFFEKIQKNYSPKKPENYFRYQSNFFVTAYRPRKKASKSITRVYAFRVFGTKVSTSPPDQ